MIPDDAIAAALRISVLLLVAVGAAGVVATREPLSQAVALGFYSFLLAAMFFLFQAPDVALSQIVVGAVISPLMILLSLSRIRRSEESAQTRGREGRS